MYELMAMQRHEVRKIKIRTVDDGSDDWSTLAADPGSRLQAARGRVAFGLRWCYLLVVMYTYVLQEYTSTIYLPYYCARLAGTYVVCWASGRWSLELKKMVPESLQPSFARAYTNIICSSFHWSMPLNAGAP